MLQYNREDSDVVAAGPAAAAAQPQRVQPERSRPELGGVPAPADEVVEPEPEDAELQPGLETLASGPAAHHPRHPARHPQAGDGKDCLLPLTIITIAILFSFASFVCSLEKTNFLKNFNAREFVDSEEIFVENPSRRLSM